jgi:hypothetical protein
MPWGVTVDVKNTQIYEHEHTKALPPFPNIIAAKMSQPVTRYVAYHPSHVILYVTSLVHLSGHEYRSSPFVFLMQVTCEKLLPWKNVS